MLACLLVRLRRRKGAVALEAIASILLMLGVFYCIWGAALMVFDQTKLNSAAQFASQGASVIYNRETYRGIPGTALGQSGYAASSAYQAAVTLLADNGQGMAPDQYETTHPTALMGSFSIACAPDPTGGAGWPGAFSAANCANGSGLGDSNDGFTQTDVDAYSSNTFWLLNPLGTATKTKTTATLGSAPAVSYSVSPSVSLP